MTTTRPRLSYRDRHWLEDLLWNYPQNLAAYQDRYRDLAQSGGYHEDETFQRHLLALSDPTGNHAAICWADEGLADLRCQIQPVLRLRQALSAAWPILCAVLEHAYLEPRSRTSGAAVIAWVASRNLPRGVTIARGEVREAKEAILVRFAVQMRMV